ncbi:Stk1 family PASTA domain-containing Ser/Thr kinase [Clostridium sp. MSJ-11]|uniref:non-specific serine/threonine protein kinase n=1 Tax=Clostridium mobile TaxID=2841512 RepID=A0ABS6EC08_9CLOT|nr:Stk1 family PASTA domain-containing Ser/Thr kinase [Clostridium mobile]MBU5482731.1 Stk1 family PASTA domain-containing Ser/Thr kinase [Clostridium mobile]
MIDTLLGNRYKLLEKIGEGGMAEVYKAQCQLLNRYVAVKILKDEFSRDSQFVEKFKREATAAASLSHNNIVNIYDVGSQDGVNYIVMEYVKGKTLKEVILERGILNNEDAVDIAIQIGKALECAHRNNIIHRDIKPHNILVTEEGLVKVADFGIAKATNSATITNTSKVIGSAHYFSPEQAKGSFVDFRTDIYSLGIVMYEMVTGKVPYDAESPVSVALKHIQEEVVPPCKINPSLSEGFNSVILKSIEKEAIKRYQNIGDLLVDLNKVKNNEPVNIILGNLDNDRTRIMDAVNVDEEEEYLEYDELEDEDDYLLPISKNKKMIIAITSIILILVVGFTSGYFLFNKVLNKSPNDSKKSIAVPNIIGLKEDEAEKAIEKEGLVFLVAGTERSDEAEGTVIRTSPSEGTPVKPNSEVRVIISSGKNGTNVPDLRDIDVEVARDMLNRLNLKLGEPSYKYDDTVPKNCIISQSPSKDTSVQPGTVIEVVVSSGPEVNYVSVPSLNGKTLEEARAILAGYNLKLGKENPVRTNDETLHGKIFKQSPEVGAQVKEGSIIDISYYHFGDGVPGENPGEIADSGVDINYNESMLANAINEDVTTEDANINKYKNQNNNKNHNNKNKNNS